MALVTNLSVHLYLRMYRLGDSGCVAPKPNHQLCHAALLHRTSHLPMWTRQFATVALDIQILHRVQLATTIGFKCIDIRRSHLDNLKPARPASFAIHTDSKWRISRSALDFYVTDTTKAICVLHPRTAHCVKYIYGVISTSAMTMFNRSTCFITERSDLAPNYRNTWDEDTYLFQALWDFYDTLLDGDRHTYIVKYVRDTMSQHNKALLFNIANALHTSGTPTIRHFLYGCRDGYVEEDRYTAVTQTMRQSLGRRINKEDILQLLVSAYHTVRENN
jgi:hypothetical protein